MQNKLQTLFSSLILIIVVSLSGYAQSPEKCGSKTIIDLIDQEHPGYKAMADQTFDYVKSIANQKQSRGITSNEKYRIPVVVHIVYQNNIQNLPDSIIQSQIDALNRDFGRKNPDTILTRTEFLPIVGAPNIEFYLATTDPEGNPTDGITRTDGDPGFFGYNMGEDNVKSTAEGGIDPWPTDKYLNIWVCDVLFGFGILGYAFPPTDVANWDAQNFTDSANQGVVIHYPVFGVNNPAGVGSFYEDMNLGRTTTHEVGHYLGLRHVWGDGDCNEDDGMDDTPQAATASQQTCDYNKNTCNESPVDFNDNIENFMDYSIDSCLNMFSAEQTLFMRTVLDTLRSGLHTWDIQQDPVGIKEHQMEANIYPNPSNGTVQISWKGNNPKALARVFSITGQAVATQTLSNPATLDLEGLPKGVYVLQLSTSQQTLRKKLVIK